jgi:hypothetical protein
MRLEFKKGLKDSVRNNRQYVSNLKAWLSDLVVLNYRGVAVLYNEEDDYGDTHEKKGGYYHDLRRYINDEDDLLMLRRLERELWGGPGGPKNPLDRVLYDHKRGTNAYFIRLHTGRREMLLTVSDIETVKATVEEISDSDPRSTFELRYRDQNVSWAASNEDSINRGRLRKVRMFDRIVENKKEETGRAFRPRVFVHSELEDNGLLKILLDIDDDLVKEYRTKMISAIQYLKGRMDYMVTKEGETI